MVDRAAPVEEGQIAIAIKAGCGVNAYVQTVLWFTNVILEGVPLLPTAPKNEDHEKYRTWQINQSFVSNNDVSKIQLTEAQLKKITENEDILRIYPEVKSLASVLISKNNFMCHPSYLH
jgi:hypothetical protein